MQTYTLSDLLRTRYDGLARQLESELQPVGVLEVLAVAQMFHDQARLLRYDSAPDPDNPDLEKARHQTGRNLRRRMAELRQLQADRFLKDRLALDLPGATSVKDVHRFPQPGSVAQAPREPAPVRPDAVAHVETKIAALWNKEQEVQIENLKKRSQFGTPRNNVSAYSHSPSVLQIELDLSLQSGPSVMPNLSPQLSPNLSHNLKSSAS